MIPIVFYCEAILGKCVKVLNGLVHLKSRSWKWLFLQHPLHHGDVAVIDVAVGDDVDQLAGDEAGDLGKHADQGGVLDHVPVVGRQHVLRALVEDGVEDLARDVEGHGVGAGIEAHFAEVREVVHAGEDAAALGVVLQIVEHPVHLVEVALGVVVLLGQLIAVGLADGAVFVGPGVPDVAAQLGDPVGFLLPDPEQLVDGGLVIGPAQGHDRKFLQIGRASCRERV